MSQEKVELVRRGIDAINRGDIEDMLAIADVPPEFEFVPSGVLVPDLTEVQRGPQGLRRVAEFLDEFDEAYLEVHELIGAGDRVFGSLTFRGAAESRVARRPAGRSGTFGPCGTAASFACRDLRTGKRPSRPPA
jgi:hypothetical protein